MQPSPRIITVTGGSKGIGRAIALRFAEEKPKIILLHYDADNRAADETLKLLADKGAEAESRRVDVSSFAEVESVFKDIQDRFGRLDVLVNNAGITRDDLLVRMSEEEWDLILRINLKSVFNCSKSVIRTMIKQRGGRIVNISSIAGQMGNAGQTNYAATKAGIIGFSKSLAREVASRNITVNAIAPGFINTEMTQALPEKAKEELTRQIPMGRIGEPQDIAEAVYWLCSDAAGYITGQVLAVNGGMYM
ncbi:MAG: 3-oxoacyl-[acyl-carrier-protein] reductase [Desulfobacteraceae bacterium]|nr:MAG: 3-oxoacyl-[acyl-carrier-protein] reductase [Desulfobacteraceae bacterium]